MRPVPTPHGLMNNINVSDPLLVEEMSRINHGISRVNALLMTIASYLFDSFEYVKAQKCKFIIRILSESLTK